MASCRHISWLQVEAGKKFTLVDGKRIQRIAQTLPYPTKQRPSLLHFVGSKHKDDAIAALFACEPSRWKARLDGNSLRLDSNTQDDDHPTLVAESDAVPPTFRPSNLVRCHEFTTHQLRWRIDDARALWAKLHSRLFFPAADIVCLFADDMGGMQGIVDYLRAMALARRPLATASKIRPRVVIVSTEETSSVTAQVLDVEELRFRLQQDGDADLLALFSEFFHAQVDGDHLSPRVRYQSLKAVLQKHVAFIREQRRNHHVLFSIEHLGHFFSAAVCQLSQSARLPFDHLLEARRYNPLGDDFKEHLERSIRLGRQLKAPREALATHLAAALLLDAYPPRMHNFDPRYVFHKLYHKTLMEAFRSVDTGISSEALNKSCEGVEDRLISAFTRLSGHTPAQVFTESLYQYQPWWRQLFTNRSCICCLRRVPEHVLVCGHSLCEPCIGIFGRTTPTQDIFLLEACPFCGLCGSKIRLKPPTAGVSVLSIDGGGIRVIIPLENLKLLQERIGPEVELQDLFHLVVGTSAGGLIGMEIFLKGLNVSQALETFKDITKDFLGRQQSSDNSLWGRFRHLAKCIVSDHCYDTIALQNSLQHVFGADQRMFDHHAGIGGTKVAVVACDLVNATPVIFANYNGIGRGHTYSHTNVRPEKASDEPFLWQAGRATSAAPFFFEPMNIPASDGHQKGYQDGAVAANNPTGRVVLSEIRTIWPELQEPDTVLSLGTGTNLSKVERYPRYRNALQDHSAVRGLRAVESKTDGEREHREMQVSLGEYGMKKIHRVQSWFSGKLPRLDNIDSMDSLAKCVRQQGQSPNEVSKNSFHLLASTLYFSLDLKPQLKGAGYYHCQGTVRCRLSGHAFWDAMQRVDTPSLVLQRDGNWLCELNPQDSVCRVCHRLRVSIHFYVSDLKEVVQLAVVGEHFSDPLSAFPRSMAWFVQQQGFDAVFGEPDHGRPGQVRCEVCTQTVPTPKKRASSSPAGPYKRSKPLPPVPEIDDPEEPRSFF